VDCAPPALCVASNCAVTVSASTCR
jgi:hypothetical protein